MDRHAMLDVAMQAIARQDTHEVDGILDYFSDDISFMMPVLAEPLRGRDELRENVMHAWPESTTDVEWSVVEGNRLVLCWRWQGIGADFADAPPLRGVSTFVFDDDGLVSDYEDWFDPDWMSRHATA